ncbi:hypothetical protein U1Q18_010396, partial [Sarracenia purpurea var. burkii]
SARNARPARPSNGPKSPCLTPFASTTSVLATHSQIPNKTKQIRVLALTPNATPQSLSTIFLAGNLAKSQFRSSDLHSPVFS